MKDSKPRQAVPLTLLGGLLVILSLAWVAELHRSAGLVLFAEQTLAASLGITLAAGWFLMFRGRRWLGLAVILALASLALFGWLAWRYQWAMFAAMQRPEWLVVLSGLGIAGLMVQVWRLVGIAVTMILLAFVALALAGGWVGVPETPIDRLVLYLMIDPNGVLGLPLRVAVEIVIPFVFFGRLLQHSGGSAWFTEIAEAAFGRFRGGAAKVAVTASALFGSISGNAVSNVVGTGVITIPLMKRTGYRSETAAAIEAVASTGGQLLPPVMGTAAFVMADLLRVPYGTVVLAALLPALLYFIAVFIQVDMIAARDGIVGLGRTPQGFVRAFLKGAHFLVPFAVLFVAFLLFQTRPQMAALAAIGCVVALAMLRPYEGQRLTLRQILQAAIEAGVSAAPVLLICAAAGMLIGLISITGVGFSLAEAAIAVSGGNALALLAVVALAAVVLGMGMPTVAVYILLATLLAPALANVGVGEIQAHLFIMYFGMMSMVTPPIALAAITAGNLAGADLWRTSWASLKLAWVAYIVPVLFVFSPSLTLNGSWIAIATTFATAIIGIYAVSVAIVGRGRGHPHLVVRLVWGVAGLLLFLPPGLGNWAVAANVAGAAGVIAAIAIGRLSLGRKEAPRNRVTQMFRR